MEKEQCRKLIELYGSYKRIWDSKHPDYKHKSVREDAWKKISEEMSSPVEDLKKKMDSLLGSYRREKSREKQSRIKGSGPDDVYTSKWYAYECFQFMADKNNPGDTQDIHDETQRDDSGVDGEGREQSFGAGSEEPTENEQPLKEGHKKRKRKIIHTNEQEDDRVLEAFELLKECVQSSDDPYHTYGQHIANELRKYDQITLAHVKHAINNIIFEADTGRFQQYNTRCFTQSYAEDRSHTLLLKTSPSGYSSVTDASSSSASMSSATNINSSIPPSQPSTSSLP